MSELLRAARYEVIPTAGIEEHILAAVPRTVTVTVTASPAKGLAATLDLSERLVGHGYRVVPHLSARLIADEAHLKDIVDQLLALRVTDVFVPAGDANPPAGKYDGALGVLAELTAMGRPFPHVGITGYPESHPAIDDDVTVQSMWDKRAHATYIVSNLCFDHRVFAAWIARVRRRGVDLPIMMGIAGPVESAKLLKVAAKIGVGESAKFLSKRPSWLLRFAAPGGYNLDRLLERCAPTLTAPESKIAGLHVFTFNQVAETERWRRTLATPPATTAPA
ncbi:MAG: methylenetetrahydrofolate reductase [Micromonosporaceae bacterium]